MFRRKRSSVLIPSDSNSIARQSSLRRYFSVSDCSAASGVRDEERLAIERQSLAPGESMCITAVVGSGKTEEALTWARAHPELRCLYLAYNKSMADDAQRRVKESGLGLRDHLHVRTFHSLAWECTADIREYCQVKENLFNQVIIKIVKSCLETGWTLFISEAIQIRQVLLNFVASADESITNVHLPHESNEAEEETGGEEDEEWVGLASEPLVNAAATSADILRMARHYWHMVLPEQALKTDREHVSITHDMYVKICQLQPWRLDSLLQGYDTLILDEGHDASDAMLDILQWHAHNRMKRVLIIYDPHQRIYQFRLGNTHMLDQMSPTFSRTLSTTFRFGPELALVAERLVRLKPAVSTFRIYGDASKATRIWSAAERDPFAAAGQRTLAVLARRNATLFAEVAAVCSAESCTARGRVKRIAFNGGVKGYKLDLIMDLYRLSRVEHLCSEELFDEADAERKHIKDKWLRRFDNVGEAEAWARAHAATEVLIRCQILKEYGERIPSILRRVKEMTCNAESADVVFSTGHKSKGLQFPRIYLLGDFLGACPGRRPGAESSFESEVNVTYVALTRAQQECYVHPALVKRMCDLSSGRIFASLTTMDCALAAARPPPMAGVSGAATFASEYDLVIGDSAARPAPQLAAEPGVGAVAEAPAAVAEALVVASAVTAGAVVSGAPPRARRSRSPPGRPYSALVPLGTTHINKRQCMARIWGCGLGGQCPNRRSRGDYCRIHYESRVHGRIDGEIPSTKLVAFRRAQRPRDTRPGASWL